MISSRGLGAIFHFMSETDTSDHYSVYCSMVLCPPSVMLSLFTQSRDTADLSETYFLLSGGRRAFLSTSPDVCQ